LPYVLGPAVDEVALAVGAPHLAELRGHDGPLPPALQGPAEQLLVVAPAVHVGAVQEVDPAVEGLVDHGDRLGVVAGAVDAGLRHAAQSDGRALEVAVSELAMAHGALLSGGSDADAGYCNPVESRRHGGVRAPGRRRR